MWTQTDRQEGGQVADRASRVAAYTSGRVQVLTTTDQQDLLVLRDQTDRQTGKKGGQVADRASRVAAYTSGRVQVLTTTDQQHLLVLRDLTDRQTDRQGRREGRWLTVPAE